jgi:hypothetical protein
MSAITTSPQLLRREAETSGSFGAQRNRDGGIDGFTDYSHVSADMPVGRSNGNDGYVTRVQVGDHGLIEPRSASCSPVR